MARQRFLFSHVMVVIEPSDSYIDLYLSTTGSNPSQFQQYSSTESLIIAVPSEIARQTKEPKGIYQQQDSKTNKVQNKNQE